LVTYLLEIALDEKGRPVVDREILRYKRGAHGSPFHFLDYQRGKGFAIVNEEDFDKAEKNCAAKNRCWILRISWPSRAWGSSSVSKLPCLQTIHRSLECVRLSYQPGSGQQRCSRPGRTLSTSGDNLQLAANYLYENYPETFDLILEKMRRRIPGMGKITPEPTADGRLLLKFQDGSFRDPFIDRYVSDGTIKMFAYLVLLHDPNPHRCCALKNPKTSYTPNFWWNWRRNQRIRPGRRPGVVSTHSPDFLNAVELDEVIG
jgi:predicted ATPase